MSKSYIWSKLYASAVLENDPRKLPLRTREAEWAIQERFSSAMPIDLAERQIITGASVRLKKIKSERIAKAIALSSLQQLDLSHESRPGPNGVETSPGAAAHPG
jgi:hypothetical protein